MKYKSIMFLGLIILLIGGCTYNSGVIQKDNVAYLKIAGNLNGISLQVDDGNINQLIDASEDTVYEISPGVHIITIRRNSEIVVKRKLYFDNQITKEVMVKWKKISYC